MPSLREGTGRTALLTPRRLSLIQIEGFEENPRSLHEGMVAWLEAPPVNSAKADTSCHLAASGIDK